MMGRRRQKGEERAIAQERMETLAQLAHERAVEGRMVFAQRYADLARKLAMRYQTGLPTSWRRRLCRSCYAYMHPGATARVRLTNTRVVWTCAKCGHANRFPYAREQKASRKVA